MSHSKSPNVNKGDYFSASKATPNTTRATKKQMFKRDNDEGMDGILNNINVVVR